MEKRKNKGAFTVKLKIYNFLIVLIYLKKKKKKKIVRKMQRSKVKARMHTKCSFPLRISLVYGNYGKLMEKIIFCAVMT